MKTMMRLAVYLTFSLCGTAVSFAQWEPAGGIPAVEFGSVGAAGKWIVASGLFAFDWPASSTDGGESWSSLSGIGPIALNPVLITAPADTFALALGSGHSIYRLRDTAQTWVRSDSGLEGVQVRQMAYMKGKGSFPNGVVAAASPASGVFLSMDLGVHWSLSDSGLRALDATSIIAIDTIFLVGTTSRGIFRSVDHGLTWSPAQTGIADTGIGVLATSAGWVFAASGTNVYQSSDKGETWSLVPKGVPATALNLVLVPTPGKGIGVAIFCVTSSGYYRLSSDDSDWVCVKGQPSTYIISSDIPFTLAAVDTVLYIADHDQMNCSMDLGNTWWQLVDNRNNGCAAEFEAGHKSGRNVEARLYNGPFISTNHGSKWISTHQDFPDGSHVWSFSVSVDTNALGYDQVTIGTDSGGVEISSDGGQTWKSLGKPYPEGHGFMCYDVAELDGIVFVSLQRTSRMAYVGDTLTGVYRTTDLGHSWQRMSMPVTADGMPSFVLKLHLFHARQGGRVLFAGATDRFYRSTDDGESWWENTDTPVRVGWTFMRQVNGSLFLATGGWVHARYTDDGGVIEDIDSAGVYRSSDDGLTWIDVTGDIHPFYIGGLAAFSPAQDPTRVYLAVSSFPRSDYGNIQTSTEGGMRWSQFDSGLRVNRSYGFGARMGADENYVYCSGHRRPWSEAELTSVGPDHVYQPAQFWLHQNYPNPFNPTTTIQYSLPSRSHVSLVVFNILGQKVVDLINGEVEAGSHVVRFDAGKLASGVYFYRLQSGNFADTKKLVLVR